MSRGLADTVTIADGVRMPLLGLGTYRSADGDEVANAVCTALELGYRGIDTASLYGNESGVGRGIRESGLAREDVFVATKIWNDEQGYEGTKAALHCSLERLGTGYVDLYLIHWAIPPLTGETWRAMEELLEEGLTRSIGVCNFLPHHVEPLLAIASVPPAVNQFEFHPRLQQPDVVRYCMERDITVQAWSPLMRGRVNEVPEIIDIAQRHAVTPVQATLRWILQRGIATIPKSVHAERIAENADIFGFDLDAEEMAVIDALDTDERVGKHPDQPPT